jgi:hypothetical protein
MGTKKYKHSVLCVGLVIVLAILSIQVTAYAQPRTQKLRLTIGSYYDGNPIANEEFELFEFGYFDDNGNLIVSDDFKNYYLDYENITSDNWQDYAEILSAYALRDNISPQCDGETNSNGILVFEETDSKLTDAVYLIVGETVTDGGVRYSCEPFILSLPNEENGVVVYDETVMPKILIDNILVEGDIKVLKVWDDNEDESNRPDSIDVQLLKDGEIFDTVTLSKDNNWRYTWSNMDPAADYVVLEKTVPNGYTVSLSRTDNIYTLTNKGDFVEKTTTANPTEKTTNNTSNTSNVSGSNITTTNVAKESDTTKDSSLPRTGLNWKPVPVLLIAGIVFIIYGVINKKFGDKDYESQQ